MRFVNSRYSAEAKVPVVAYTTSDKDGVVKNSGELFVSTYIVPDMKKHPQGILIYRGQRSSKNGDKTYHDLKVMSREQAELASSV